MLVSREHCHQSVELIQVSASQQQPQVCRLSTLLLLSTQCAPTACVGVEHHMLSVPAVRTHHIHFVQWLFMLHSATYTNFITTASDKGVNLGRVRTFLCKLFWTAWFYVLLCIVLRDFYLRQVNEVNGRDNVFVRRGSVSAQRTWSIRPV